MIKFLTIACYIDQRGSLSLSHTLFLCSTLNVRLRSLVISQRLCGIAPEMIKIYGDKRKLTYLSLSLSLIGDSMVLSPFERSLTLVHVSTIEKWIDGENNWQDQPMASNILIEYANAIGRIIENGKDNYIILHGKFYFEYLYNIDNNYYWYFNNYGILKIEKYCKNHIS